MSDLEAFRIYVVDYLKITVGCVMPLNLHSELKRATFSIGVDRKNQH